MVIKNSLKTFFVVIASATLVACATQKPATDSDATQAAAQTNIPDWVLNPTLEDGVADTQCIPAQQGIGMNYLKSKATALARAELAKQIEIKVKAMDKTYQRLVDSAEGSSVGGTFENVSKQVTNKNLSGSRAVKMNYVTMPNNEQNFCVMVAMSPEVTKTLFKELVNSSGNTVSPRNEAVLYEQFLANKAIKELEAEFTNSN